MAGDRILGAVLEPRRRAILRLLAQRPRTVGDLASEFDVSRPAISQHLAVLREAGLVASDTRAGRSTYRVLEQGVAAGRAALAAVASELPGEPDDAPAPAPASASAPAEDPEAVVVAVPLALAPEAAFSHLTDPVLLPRWLGERAQLEPRPGGAFRVELGGGDVAAGAYVEVDPPRRVAFTWGAEGVPGELGPGTSLVEVDVQPADGGGCVLRLAHHGLPAWARGAHLATWARQLAELASLPPA
jgi:uncharacterized protein YndB with AHSA1/START domain/DNA-binding transcriptional ArsR family regulator